MISKENQIQVFETIATITQRKGSRKKMCSIFEISDEFKSNKIDAPKVFIEGCIDLLIQHKLVRYFRNDKGYIYFGITQFGWERWDAKCAADKEVSA